MPQRKVFLDERLRGFVLDGLRNLVHARRLCGRRVSHQERHDLGRHRLTTLFVRRVLSCVHNQGAHKREESGPTGTDAMPPRNAPSDI